MKNEHHRIRSLRHVHRSHPDVFGCSVLDLMTPRELRDKFITIYMSTKMMHDPLGTLDELESLLSSALEEAYDKGLGKYLEVSGMLNDAAMKNKSLYEQFNLWKSQIEQARAAAYEECAKIVEGFNLPDNNEFYWYKQQTAAVEAIRQAARELK